MVQNAAKSMASASTGTFRANHIWLTVMVTMVANGTNFSQDKAYLAITMGLRSSLHSSDARRQNTSST